MRVEISRGRVHPTADDVEPLQLRGPEDARSLNIASEIRPNTEYINLDSEVKNICVAKYWVIKRGLTSATGLGIAAWSVVAFGGIVSLLVNPGYDACVNTAAAMITVGVALSAISAILYTRIIGYCRCQELAVSHYARKLAMGEGGGRALVALSHLEQPMEVMAPLDVIERARLRAGLSRQSPAVLQYTRGMTLKYGCVGRDGKTATVYLPDPDAPIDGYPLLKASVITCLVFFYVGVSVITTFLITWVSAYPDDHRTMTVCVVMTVLGGFLSLIGLAIGVYVYSLCLRYEIEDAADYEKNTYSNPIMTIS
ncbi:uncharacterized protein [Palaemon carinicauda]|uniref:uncharacterized protein n=1 Tax=Palaemon carinicauda TaxID=392227 RepID=UPI0035B59373